MPTRLQLHGECIPRSLWARGHTVLLIPYTCHVLARHSCFDHTLFPHLTALSPLLLSGSGRTAKSLTRIPLSVRAVVPSPRTGTSGPHPHNGFPFPTARSLSAAGKNVRLDFVQDEHPIFTVHVAQLPHATVAQLPANDLRCRQHETAYRYLRQLGGGACTFDVAALRHRTARCARTFWRPSKPKYKGGYSSVLDLVHHHIPRFMFR